MRLLRARVPSSIASRSSTSVSASSRDYVARVNTPSVTAERRVPGQDEHAFAADVRWIWLVPPQIVSLRLPKNELIIASPGSRGGACRVTKRATSRMRAGVDEHRVGTVDVERQQHRGLGISLQNILLVALMAAAPPSLVPASAAERGRNPPIRMIWIFDQYRARP